MLLSFLTFLSFPFLIDSCLETPTKCPCPTVRYIDQIGIANLEYGSYLANRTTTRPRVTVTDECQILADVSELDTQNHYLMVFREGAPPIFMKRLSNDTDKIIQLSDMTCVKMESEYVWKYYGGVINDLSVAVQSNEEMCECNSSLPHGPTVNFTILECDKFAMITDNTDEPDNIITLLDRKGNYNFRLTWSPTNSIVVDYLTCVDKTWYFNSMPVVDPIISTYGLPREFECGCLKFSQSGVSNSFTYTPDNEGLLADYTLQRGTASYDGCSAEFECPDILVIFSNGYKPMMYPPGTKPVVSCANSPLASSPNSPKFWYVDGIMLNDPWFGCYANSCPCPFAFLQDRYAHYYLEGNPILQNITSDSVFGPYAAKMRSNETCPPLIDYVSGKIVIIETNKTTTLSSFRYNTTCSNVTKKWTIEGQEYERLYTIGIDDEP